MRTTLITGATGGIGTAVAENLAARGDRLVLGGRDPDRLRELAGRLPGARVLPADLGDPGTLSADGLPPRLDVLVHCAGVVALGPVADADAAVWERTLAVNLTGPAVLTRLALPALRAARGHVVFLNSGAGLHAGPGWSAYAASKFGLRALADALRAEEAAHGVRVTTVYPGRTATAMQAAVHAQEGREYDPGRWIQPAAVAAAVRTALDLPVEAHLTEVTIRPGLG
ncbi:short chain dehydrogenase [Pilimelia terevasa]|uniref:Short chain dehydrogenase n=1 Tax=Pilimelia terevasa TaxID=53372 RepID=A0A8J3BST3_9ACTN|nr:SDR family oxidoreductase [Pilimelia terevasa]GGK37335.1 short chain dehydrogenase [Pilimelia terevasa]